jgi:hypothetical protein
VHEVLTRDSIGSGSRISGMDFGDSRGLSRSRSSVFVLFSS